MARPGIGELGEKPDELGALGGSEARKRLGEVLAALPAEAPGDLRAVVGQGDPGAPGVVGVGLAAHEPEVDRLLVRAEEIKAN